MKSPGIVIIIGILLWIVAFSVWWPLIMRFAILLDEESEITSVSEIISAFTQINYIQITLGVIATAIGTVAVVKGIMMKLQQRKVPKSKETQYATVLYDKVKIKEKYMKGKKGLN
jgi:hypothetical protein